MFKNKYILIFINYFKEQAYKENFYSIQFFLHIILLLLLFGEKALSCNCFIYFYNKAK